MSKWNDVQKGRSQMLESKDRVPKQVMLSGKQLREAVYDWLKKNVFQTVQEFRVGDIELYDNPDRSGVSFDVDEEVAADVSLVQPTSVGEKK